MVIATKVVLSAAIAFNFVMQMFLICSANAHPIEDFFFADQPTIVEKRVVERKEPIVNGIDSEDEGNGVGPNEGSGSGIVEGSGDGTTSTLYETHTATDLHISNLPQETTEKEEIIGDKTPTLPISSSTTNRHESNDKETTIEVSTRLDELSKTLTNEITETKSISLLTTESLNLTEDPNQLNTRSSVVVQATTQENIAAEIFSTEMTELNEVTIGTEEPFSKLLSIQVCGKQYYCLAGRRGPCPANEVLVEDVDNNTLEAPSYCSALSSFPWRGCLPSVNEETAAITSVGRCNLKSTKEPCSGLPPNYRYHPIKKICRPTSNITGNWLAYECGDDQVFIGLNQNLGSCVCLNKKHLIYIGDNQCYHPYTRGPCNKGMWLVPSTRRELECRISPCPEKQIDGRHFYWKGDFHGPAGCYSPNTRGPCPEGRTFVVDDYVLGHARCERD
ncbi:hypothetical protein GHT06_020997 [Daphnia sinensis]|uniref:DUF4789 domain-containing protein n=1 Tax=Daphnia sinensis TaxID=1820382 RepID=A0AAD5KZL2_9CRUS|nr:hypothetical protein GHT06_020997 [Daphnia sinensis]